MIQPLEPFYLCIFPDADPRGTINNVAPATLKEAMRDIEEQGAPPDHVLLIDAAAGKVTDVEKAIAEAFGEQSFDERREPMACLTAWLDGHDVDCWNEERVDREPSQYSQHNTMFRGAGGVI
jgi:hypothetical protein